MILCFVCGTVPENRGHERADDCSCGLLWTNRTSKEAAIYFGDDSRAQLHAPRGDTGPVVRLDYHDWNRTTSWSLTFDNFWDLANEIVVYWAMES